MLGSFGWGVVGHTRVMGEGHVPSGQIWAGTSSRLFISRFPFRGEKHGVSSFGSCILLFRYVAAW